MLANPNDITASLVDQLLGLLAFEIDFRLPDDPYAHLERRRIAAEYSNEAHSIAAAHILGVATSAVVEHWGPAPVIAYLDSMIEWFGSIARSPQDLACERRSLLAWRDCVDSGDRDLVGRAILYSIDDSAECADGLHAALDVAVWMLAHFTNADDRDDEPPYGAYDVLVSEINAARLRSFPDGRAVDVRLASHRGRRCRQHHSWAYRDGPVQ